MSDLIDHPGLPRNYTIPGRTIADELERLRAEIAEQQDLIERISGIATNTVNALRGDPPALVAWSWHDLPASAAAMRAALIAAMEIVQRERVRIAYNAKGAPPAIEIGYADILHRLDAVIALADAALGSER
jgi:hypothetical protein